MSKFKKIVFMVSFVTVLCFSFNFNACVANAITADEIRAQIAALMAQISELQKQLGQTEVWCHGFDRNLKYGNEGEEVRALQIVLDKQGFTPIPHKYGDKNYGNFEEYTASAVVGFQQKYKQDILDPWGLEYGTGYVGSTTREKLNELYGCGTLPVITCENLWWYDNNIQYCQQKQFCGTYMYLGLHTFATKQDCETSLAQVVQPSITVLSPNGGEQWTIGNTYDITWDSIGVDKVNIEIMGSSLRKTIANLNNNPGFYNYIIPDTFLPGKYSIRVHSYDLYTGDDSDSNFSIVAAQATTCHISALWAWDYCSSSCKCNEGEGDCDTDADCADGLYCAYNVGANYGQDVKMDVCETTPIITCEDLCGDGICQEIVCLAVGCPCSETVESCPQDCKTLTPSITVTSPNGGEQWVVGNTYDITWDCPSGVDTSRVDIFLKDKRVGVEEPIGDLIECSLEKYSWKAGDWITPGENSFKIQLRHIAGSQPIIDESDNYFSIVAAQATTCHISALWAWDYCSSSCKCNEGEGDCDTDADCADGLYCAYNVGANYGQDVKMDVCEVKQEQQASITVLSPNGGEQLVKGEIHRVKWESQGVESVRIYIYDDNISGSGSTNYIVPNNGSVSASLGYYDWTIGQVSLPLGNGEHYKIRIDAVSDSSIRDHSNNYFKIIDQTTPSITVTSPNGGEQWMIGETYSIQWDTVGSLPIIEINLYKGGSYERRIVSALANDGGDSWTIPIDVVSGDYYKIRVEGAVNGIVDEDFSDNYFSIVAAPVTTCHTSDLWAWDYCSSSCKCDVGEGDCDTDADCADGLYCAKNVGVNYSQISTMDVCEVKQQATCSDTDGGKDYYKKGTVTLSDGVKLIDYCMTGAYEGDVVEYYCVSDGHGMTNYSCPNGCVDGACVQETGLKGLGTSCSITSECQSGFCVDGVCCNNLCAGRDCQTCGALSSQGIGHCGYVKTSSADPRNDCSNGTTVSNGCESNDCSGKNWSCGVVQNHDDGGCPACQTCDGVNATCKAYANNSQDVNGAKTCESCKYCMNGNCANIANGQDLFSECSQTGCGTGNCDGAGKCGWFTSGEHGCAKCKTCDGATSLSCKYIAKGQKDAQGSKVCNQPHYRCDGRANCTNPSTLTQTECFNLGSSDCAGLCPHWCNGESMCKECWTSSMKVYSSDYCSGTGMGVYSGSCNQLGGSCKCFYERYLYE